MDWLVIWQKIGVVTFAAIVGWGLTWLARFVAPHLQLIDKPDGGRKLHRHPTPLMGGVAVFFAILTTVLLSHLFFAQPMGLATTDYVWLTGVLVSAGLICAVGLWDDRWPMRPRTKFLWQIAAALPFILVSRPITEVQVLGLEVDLGLLGIPFAIFWILFCINVVNLIDGLDGLAGTIGLLVTLTIGTMSVMSQNPGLAMLSFVAAGSLVGFLVHNWPPAKIFLGDAGSMTIGFLAGALSIEACLKSAAGFTLIVPLAILSIPFIDTTMAILRRKLMGRSIGDADRFHFHHQLQDLGYTRTQSLLVIGLISATTAGAALVSFALASDWPALITCVAVFTALITNRIFGQREVKLLQGHVKALSSVLDETSARLKTRLVLARLIDPNSDRFDEVWNMAQSQAMQMGADNLSVQRICEFNAADNLTRTWSSDKKLGTTDPDWILRYTATPEEGVRIVAEAHGSQSSGATARQLDEMSFLLSTLSAGLETDESQRHSIPMVQPAATNTPEQQERRAA